MAKSKLKMSRPSKERSKSAYRTMSSKPQCNPFETMRSRSSKKRPITESPSKESKTQEPKPPTSDQVNATVESTKEAVEDSGNGSDKTSPVLKKCKLTITIAECLSELEKKADVSVSELKKKAAVFDPKRAAFWENGEDVPFLFLTGGLDAIAEESGRTAITEIICNMLRTVMETTPKDLVRVVYFLSNKTAGLQLGVGDAIIIKALAESYSISEAKIKEYNVGQGQRRDLGLVAIKFAVPFRKTQLLIFKLKALSVAKVFETFQSIVKESVDDRKKKFITKLLVRATDCELKYLVPLLLNKLRIGLGPQTLLAALGHAALYSEKKSLRPANMSSLLEEAANILKQVYSVLPVYDEIVSALLSASVWDLPKKCTFTPGAPIKPMTAKPIKEVSEILDKFQNMRFTCEYKYDGERAQIHYMEDGSVEIYSRNNLKKTERFPDVVATVSRLKHQSVTSFVLDCEIVAYDRQKKKILPHQILSTRPHKNVDTSEIKVEVCIYAFDILYVNSKALLKEQLETRRQHLYKSFEEAPGYFQFAVTITSNDAEEIQKFLDASVDSSIGDSLDLVPIGGLYGRGKRTGVYGAFLLACYDHNNEEYQSICKVGSGFSEANLKEYSARLRSKVIPKPKDFYRYSGILLPDVWFEPIEVWKVKASDLTLSKNNCAAIGIVDRNKGISLRFPRILRVREDKSPEDATTSEMVADMFMAQKQRQQNESC